MRCERCGSVIKGRERVVPLKSFVPGESHRLTAAVCADCFNFLLALAGVQRVDQKRVGGSRPGRASLDNAVH